MTHRPHKKATRAIQKPAEKPTARKRLETSETLFRELAENVQEVFWVTNPEKSRMLYINPSYQTVWGRSCESLYKRPISFVEAIHPEDRPRVLDAIRRQVDHYDEEYRVLRPDGTLRWIRDRAFPVRDKKGKVSRIVGIAEDITRYKLASEALKRSEARLTNAQHQARLGSWELDLAKPYGTDDNLIYCSAEIARIFGIPYLPEMVKYQTIFGRVHIDDRQKIQTIVRKAIAQCTRFTVDFRIVRPSGEERHVLGQGEALYDAEGKAYRLVGTHLDITERKQLEEQVRQAQKMESIGRLAGGVAHDFNNILTIIKGYVDLLQDRFPPEDQTGRDIAEIEKATAQASSLTRQLLAFSRKQVVQTRVLDLHQVIRDVETMLRRMIGEDVTLETQLQAEHPNVNADPGQLEQILLNLSANARDAMPNGGKLLFETINAECPGTTPLSGLPHVEGQCVVLSIQDTGSGMDPVVLSHLFEPFFTTKAPGFGTGLGLATVYGIIRQSGGHIAVESEPGIGTTFRLYFPVTREGVQPLVLPPAPVRSLNGTETILVVEDEPNIRQVLLRSLSHCGYRVREAADGRDALGFFKTKTEPIDLVITDMIMPVMGGAELTQALHYENPDIKIVYMSGYTDRMVMENGLLTPSSTFIQKPFDVRELLQKVRTLLDKSPNEEAVASERGGHP